MRRFDLLRQILFTHVFDLTQIPAKGSGIWYLVQVKDMRDQDLSQQIETSHRFETTAPK